MALQEIIANLTALVNEAKGLLHGTSSIDQSVVFVGFDPTSVAQTETGTVQAASVTPAIPASTTPQANNTGFDQLVTIVGGTVSQINIGGLNTGMTGGTFVVPAGSSITLTYSVVPTGWWWSPLVGKPAGFYVTTSGGNRQKVPFFNP